MKSNLVGTLIFDILFKVYGFKYVTTTRSCHLQSVYNLAYGFKYNVNEIFKSVTVMLIKNFPWSNVVFV